MRCFSQRTISASLLLGALLLLCLLGCSTASATTTTTKTTTTTVTTVTTTEAACEIPEDKDTEHETPPPLPVPKTPDNVGEARSSEPANAQDENLAAAEPVSEENGGDAPHVMYNGNAPCIQLGFASQPVYANPSAPGGSGCSGNGWGYVWSPFVSTYSKVGCTAQACETRLGQQVPTTPAQAQLADASLGGSTVICAGSNQFSRYFCFPERDYLCVAGKAAWTYNRPRLDDPTQLTPKTGTDALETLTQDLLYCAGSWLERDGKAEVFLAPRGTTPGTEWFEDAFALSSCVMNGVSDFLDAGSPISGAVDVYENCVNPSV